MTVTEAFGGVADLLASLSPEKIVTLKASTSMSERVEVLVNRKKEGLISEDENAELERFLGLDLLISMAKARARQLLKA
jgi:CBS domain containing-hemolysin-like protein